VFLRMGSSVEVWRRGVWEGGELGRDPRVGMGAIEYHWPGFVYLAHGPSCFGKVPEHVWETCGNICGKHARKRAGQMRENVRDKMFWCGKHAAQIRENCGTKCGKK